MDNTKYFPAVEDIQKASGVLEEILEPTPLQKNPNLSDVYDAQVYLKREDLQMVRSYKIRGAYNKIRSIAPEVLKYGIVCASAGNHAQGVAFACAKLEIKGTIFMPKTTPKQKIDQVRMFGREFVDIQLVGDTFDDSAAEAILFANEFNKLFIHPFDDLDVIAGQGTVAVEIMNDIEEPIDYIFGSIGGGGLMAGVSSYFKHLSAHTKVIGVESAGAASMKEAVRVGEPVALPSIDKFVDGAAVKLVGNETFEICKANVDDIVAVPEGKVCTTILDLYNKHAVIAEPAGALPVAALDFYASEIKGKNVVVIISGGNNDYSRMQEIKERSLIYEGLLYYFIVSFPQRSGALRQFLTTVLGPNDDITTFEYTKKNNKESGPALVGIELGHPDDYNGLVARMVANGFEYKEVNNDSTLFALLV